MVAINGDPEPNEGQPLLPEREPSSTAAPPDTAGDYGTMNKLPLRGFNFQDIRMTIAGGMMDLSLFIANTNQLANVIRTPEHVRLTDLEVVTLVLICLSILLQVSVVLLLIWIPPSRPSSADANRGTVTCVFLILVINVLVACLNNEQQHYVNNAELTLANCTRAITPQ